MAFADRRPSAPADNRLLLFAAFLVPALVVACVLYILVFHAAGWRVSALLTGTLIAFTAFSPGWRVRQQRPLWVHLLGAAAGTGAWLLLNWLLSPTLSDPDLDRYLQSGPPVGVLLFMALYGWGMQNIAVDQHGQVDLGQSVRRVTQQNPMSVAVVRAAVVGAIGTRVLVLLASLMTVADHGTSLRVYAWPARLFFSSVDRSTFTAASWFWAVVLGGVYFLWRTSLRRRRMSA